MPSHEKTFILLACVLSLTGCGTIITVPIDQSLISTDQSTLIVYHEQGFTDEFQVFIDEINIGKITSETPLKLEVKPGSHKLHVEVLVAIDRITEHFFEKGKTYYMKIWLDIGMWVSSIRIDTVQKLQNYEVRSHRQ